MPSNELFLTLALLLGASLVAGLFGYLYRLKRQNYLLLWSCAWGVLALHFLTPAAAAWHSLLAAEAAAPSWATAMHPVNRWLLSAAGLLFVIAARSYSRLKPPVQFCAGAAAAMAVWVFIHWKGWTTLSPVAGAGIIFSYVAFVFWEESRKEDSLSEKLLAWTFLLWGAMLLATTFGARLAGRYFPDTRLLTVIPQLLASLVMVVALYEEEKRRVERNMLALSNLNLTTSTFVGGEIQKMLSQALERVLSVARIPAGAFFLRHAEPGGPTSVVAIGLSDRFCAASQEEDLDDQLVQMVARVGGMVVFHELHRPERWSALEEREQHFRRFRALALEQGLKTVVGISLLAKDRVFGLLLLGTPDSRRFTPAELRLLLALGHQIGMAVENSYLVQQTSRRTEELHVMNEIGRALSSTLDPDALFEKIYAEIQRLFDVTNFYIAFYDPALNRIEFKMEVTEGQRIPERSRAAGNHLTEYMVRTRQPVLIREDFVGEARRLGVQPIQNRGSFCGVPLIVHDRSIGVMAVHSMQERVFDEGHLELLRVLASEAAIAIENARLFHEQDEKSRQLVLLNEISRHAISTLNTEEMLAKIAQEMEAGLSYEHMGIGLLDYSSKEIILQAEAGSARHRSSVVGRRLSLDEGLIGHVARTGRRATLGDLGAPPKGRPLTVLPDAVSAIGFAIIYGDQVLGVVYVETFAPHEFTPGEIQLLTTLTDLVASALHNSFTYQKAQEQAITDGLTGVKTHRYFMETLSAEWKRATRANRPFALVLIDLDRFKFVNDFYGHLEGDVVLQRVSAILEQNCRRSDVVARYGGDEFVILMPETSLEQGLQIASKLRAWLAADSMLKEKNITGSFGIACFPEHGSTPQELIQMADASMYISKHSGGNAVSTPEHRKGAEEKHWKRDVLEAYLGVTLKRMFTTGPEAFEEIRRRLLQFTKSLASSQKEARAQDAALPAADMTHYASGIAGVPPAVIETVTSLAYAVDAKDHFTQGHSRKVAAYSVILCRALGLSDGETEEVRLAAILHDVGKVGIAEAVLNKGGPLNAEEWEAMKAHADLGARLLEPLHGIRGVRLIVRHHHEFFDGSGYPDALAGPQIPLGARIVTIADAYDTITSERAYKKRRSPEDALRELERCAGAQFDPQMIAAFVQAMRQRPSPLVTADDPAADSLLAPAPTAISAPAAAVASPASEQHIT
jgi:diguanylate cyclase (GGDEF)-like protein